jgi:dihydroxyacetone kinase-like predicted kinase
VAVLRDRFGELGDSLLVVGDPVLVRVHIHTSRPGQAIDLALGYGSVDQVKIDNMQEQHDRLRGTSHSEHAEEKKCGLAVVSVGDGFTNVYRSLGATIIPGGQTFNPSTRELLDGLLAIHAREYVLLPNNRNVLLSARQAGAQAERPVEIVQTRNLAEGVAAALAFQPDRGSEENAMAMRRVVADIRTGLVTRAVRATVVDDRTVQTGDFLGIVDDRVDSIGSDPASVSLQVLQSIGANESEVITVYAGEGTTSDDVDMLRARVSAEFTTQQVDVVHGGQPLYLYILACE